MHSEEKYVLILGAGQTGLSAINFLKTKNFKIFDTRNFIDLPENIKNNFLIKENLISEDGINIKLIDYVICSPGFDLSHQLIRKLKDKNISIKSDIEVFIENNDSKIILVSGTNGKTTVSLLLEKFISGDLLREKLRYLKKYIDANDKAQAIKLALSIIPENMENLIK